MTSIQLFPPVEHDPKVPTEWGTGKFKEDVNIWIPGPPTWHQKGEPIDQYYTLTQLKLSNIRSNDELLPKPQDSTMGQVLINKDFPAEHPYSSHMARYAVFPNFISPEDPKRGVHARREQPINAEMPATANDVTIVHKTKGTGDRWEIQALPKDSEKKGLEWKGEAGFHQLVKTHGGKQQYYPIPPKTVAPNLQDRPADMKVSDRTANAMRNVERDQWQTSYNLSHTGLGPSNPKKLDNLEDKWAKMDTFGVDDDNLYPRSVNEYDPPRPFEGRLARQIIPKPPPQRPDKSIDENTGYIRKKTLREREENRLLNGQEYINLPSTQSPDNKHMSLRWKELNDTAHPNPNLEVLLGAKEGQTADDIPYPPVEGATKDNYENYLQTSKEKKDEEIQEIEAQNRFNVLESHKPDHDIASLNYKYGHVHEREKPSTFYGHEGKYNEERAGLYKTSYIPERLAHSMNALETSGPEIMNTRDSHVDALGLPVKLNHDMNEAFRYSRTFGWQQPNLSGDRRDPREIIQPMQDVKEGQKRILQPNAENARLKVQEGDVLQKESTMGNSYNTHKFLQDYDLPIHARQEPLNIISTENQKLRNVRSMSNLKPQKNVSFSDSVTVASSTDNGAMRFASAPAKFHSYDDGVGVPSKENVNTTQYISTHAMWNKENEAGNLYKPKPFTLFSTEPSKAVVTVSKRQQVFDIPDRKPVRRAATFDGTEYKDEFGSKSTNFCPTNLRHSVSFDSAYKNQFPVHDLGYKHDPRLSWEPGYGAPRPQTYLLQMQDSFSKSETRKKFHSQFRENNSDLRSNIIRGKKHSFEGVNCQILHG